VLLVYPIWVSEGGRGRLQRMLPPLGILSIASYLESKGYDVHVVDLHAEQLRPEQFRDVLRALRPRFVGVTVLSSHFVPAHYVAAMCKQEVPDCKVFCGGVHAESCPEEMLRHRAFDAVGRGDGEELMLELVQGRPYADVAGLSYRDDNRVVHNPPRPVEMDLDRYPFPAYHLIDLNNYFPPVGTYRDLPAINLLMTRGCPGACTFCNSAKTTLRGRSVAKMIELVKMLRYEHGIRQFSFYDDTFTATPKAVREFCQRMIDEKIDASFVCYARGDMFSESMAALLAKAGCHQVLLGIESGSATLMQKIGKPIDKQKYRDVVRIAHAHGIEVRAGFIIGHYEETLETMRESLEFAVDLDVDFFQPSIMTPYPGTQLYAEAKAKGLLLHEKYELYGQGEVVMKMKHLQPEDVHDFYKRSFAGFYLRPRAVWQQLQRLRSWHHARDLAKTAYAVFVEGLSEARAGDLRGWLDFDVGAVSDPAIALPAKPRLTFAVRQREDFSDPA
jgi:anaerobic magnesium-protoporphyrin IX monomethyl ester cyclase